MKRKPKTDLPHLPTWYEVTLASIGDGVITTDAQGRIEFLNVVAEALCGWSMHAATGRPLESVFCLVEELNRKPVESPAARVLRDGVAVMSRNHFLLIAADGAAHPIECGATPIRDAQGLVAGASLVFRDISDRRRSERKAKDALAYAQNIIATLREPFVVLDDKLHVQTANGAFYRRFRVNKGETEGRFIYDLGNGQWNIPRLRTLLEEVLHTSDSVTDFEVEHDFPSIGSKIMLLNSSRVESLDGGQNLILLAIEDITEDRRAEIAVQEQAATLADLHRRKDEFLAMLSHELRNPLAPILNAVLLLRLQVRDSPVQQQAVGIIERQVGQLRHIVDDLLEVARIATGRVQLRLQATTAGDVVSHAIETARPLIVQRGHDLTVTIPAEPIHLLADAARLEQVVVNLLTNAVKYTTEGGHISLSVAQDGAECVVRVQDDGVGIAPETLPHVFDLFTQAERSLARSQGGLGIGLALAQQLVEMHHGRVEAHSELGKGSEFVVRLPVAPPPEANALSMQVDAALPAFRSLRVLVVEDNVDTARSLTMLLEASGHHVRNAFDGSTALEEALDYRPNVVLLDIGLPGLDGYKVAKWMRNTLKNVTLVAVTGYGKDEDRQRSLAAGFNHHLVKPADFADIVKILETVAA